MRKLAKTGDIWVLRPTMDDLKEGARYAAISLPWSFNRMMMNTGSRGQQLRALNIAKGVVGQEVLRRHLERNRVQLTVQRKSHRDDDLFDLKVSVPPTDGSGEVAKMDLKTFHYYRDYASFGREPLTQDLLVRHGGYAGPDWRRFFPMLVPHTQIEQSKELYCFAVADSIDIRQDPFTDRSDHVLTAFPFGRHLPFLSSSKLCLQRERANKGFNLEIEYLQDSLLDASVHVRVNGEWGGRAKAESKNIEPSGIRRFGPYSCVSSFEIDPVGYATFGGRLAVKTVENRFTEVVRNSNGKNVNVPPQKSLYLDKRDFCNLVLPSHYQLYVLGWIYKDTFLRRVLPLSWWAAGHAHRPSG